MSISYSPLWKLLNERNISKMELANMVGISNATLAKLSRNEPITLSIVDKICNQLLCNIEDIVKHIPDNQSEDSLTSVKNGMIVMAIISLSDSDDIPQPVLRPCVILREAHIQNDSDSIYLVAPLTTLKRQNIHSQIDISFKQLDIGMGIKDGTILLSKMTLIEASSIKKYISMLPDEYQDKVNPLINALYKN